MGSAKTDALARLADSEGQDRVSAAKALCGMGDDGIRAGLEALEGNLGPSSLEPLAVFAKHAWKVYGRASREELEIGYGDKQRDAARKRAERTVESYRDLWQRAVEDLARTEQANGAGILEDFLSDEQRRFGSFRFVVGALGDLGGDDARKLLERVFSDAKDRFHALPVGEALGRIGTAEAVEFLARALIDEDAGIRQAAARGLAAVEDTEVLSSARGQLLEVSRKGAEYFRSPHPGYSRESDEVEREEEAVRVAHAEVVDALRRVQQSG